MKINPIKNLETESIGDVESIEASIAADSLPFLFDLVTKSFYSDSIGSICREITSNCFDAHKEINSEEAVIVKKSYSMEDGCWYIHFIDKGIGLSAERIIKIFMNYFSSTKRESNDMIGGFGIGSKSPLSYQDMFYITSCHNGVKYECILSRGASKPELDSLYGLETIEEMIDDKLVKVKYPKGIATDSVNGTEIKIEIKTGDLNKFKSALLTQLCYFDDVYFEDWGIDNEYKIIEGDTFKYRSTNNFSDLLHIVYGKVCYPIDFNKLGIRPVDIPVAVKFNIGELQVTPNRESLIYNEESIELINTKIKETIKELVNLYNSQNPEITSIWYYLERKNERPHIKFADNIKLFIPKKYGVENAIVYSHFPSLDIPDDPFFDWKIIKAVNEGIETLGDTRKLNTINRCIIKYKIDSKNFNKYTNAFISSEYIATCNNLSYFEYCTKLDLYTYRPRASWAERFDFVTIDGRRIKQVPILGKAKLIYEYKKHIASIVLANATNYKDIVVDEEWLKEYKRQNKENSAAYKRKLNGKVVGYLNYHHRSEHKISSLLEYKILIYDVNNSNLIANIQELLLSRKHSFAKDKNNKGKGLKRSFYNKFGFLKVAESNIKLIKDLPNAMHANEFFTDKRFERLFRDIKTVDVLRTKWYLEYNTIMHNISPYYYSKIKKLKSFVETHKFDRNEFIKKTLDRASLNKDIEMEIKELDIFFEKMDVIKYISYSCPDPILAEIFRFKKKLKLNPLLYSLNKPMTLKKEVEVIEVLEINNPIVSEFNENECQFINQNNLSQILI